MMALGKPKLLTKFEVATLCFFNISQGCVATLLRCGGKNEKYFTANSLLNPMVKEF